MILEKGAIVQIFRHSSRNIKTLVCEKKQLNPASSPHADGWFGDNGTVKSLISWLPRRAAAVLQAKGEIAGT